MSFAVLMALVLALGVAWFAALERRHELQRMARTLAASDKAVRTGQAKAQLAHPVIDLSRCLGCGTCVKACPESDVLELVHGQAMVVRGAHCVGTANCEAECPTGAITVTLGDIRDREDIPALDENFEALGTPGLFLAGEVTAHALIKTAIDHGVAVGREVGRRIQQTALQPAADDPELFDLVIVGAGPAGIACSLEAKLQGLRFVTIDQELRPGGTVGKYPRRKLVLTQPVEMPLYGRFKQNSYTKEELIELWQTMTQEAELPIRGGETFLECNHVRDGIFEVHTDAGVYRSRYVCLALGRRGTPRKLDVPGEDLPKVAYSLLDAKSYNQRRILVVGGGDSAVEAALGLAEQDGNLVALSYRGAEFTRTKSKNKERLEFAMQAGRVQLHLQSQVSSIEPHQVTLELKSNERVETLALPNDDVFVMIGGLAPIELLKRCGVSFDTSLIPAQAAVFERGTGLLRALGAGFVLSLLALLYVALNLDYYLLPLPERPAHPKHDLLRPSMGIGLFLGLVSVFLILANLLYLVRRSGRLRYALGTLQAWMTSHVATGILAFLCALLHSAMSPRNTVGGHAFVVLGLLVITGAVGRYLYSYIPRAANGRELELREIRARLERLSAAWDQGQQQFRANARLKIDALIEQRQWRSNLFGRLFALFGSQRGLRRTLRDLEQEGQKLGLAQDQVHETLDVARSAYGAALSAAHFEDLRALMGSWRYLHRWGAALLLVLVVLHVFYALSYGAHFFEEPSLAPEGPLEGVEP